MIQVGAKLLLKTKRLTQSAKIPTRAYESDAGLDLFADEDATLFDVMGVTMIKTGIAVELPYGTAGLILDRGSMGAKGIKVYGGVIDAGYRGELLVGLGYMSKDSVYEYKIKAGDKIAQLVIVPILLPDIYEVKELSGSERGDNKLGSTGE